MTLPAIQNLFKSNGGGRKPNPKKLMKTRLFGKMLAEKCMKIKEIEPRPGRASLAIRHFSHTYLVVVLGVGTSHCDITEG